jgi:hypothetical protein
MIALFNTEQESINFSNLIHEFLIRNRTGYLADKWSNLNKSDNENKWYVKLPNDIDSYEEKIDLTGIELIDKLPENWRNIEEL